MSEFITLKVERPDEQLFIASEKMLEVAGNWNITTADEAIAAGEDLRTVKQLYKDLESRRTAITGPINKALREVNALFKPAKSWLAQAESILKDGILEFQNEQARIAREAQAKVDAEAAKERKKLERKATVAAAVGMSEKAEELREEIETTVAPVVTSAAPKIEGVVRRETWKAVVVNKAELLLHILEERPDMMPLVSIDETMLTAQARVLKGEMNLPGVRVTKEASIAAQG